MAKLRRMLRSVLWTLRGVQVTALVGKSGTGKSFRAQLIARKYNIEAIIDDGLLIQGQKILAGTLRQAGAGCAIEAVKTAVFHDESHAREVLPGAGAHRGRSASSIIATSEKMVGRASRNGSTCRRRSG